MHHAKISVMFPDLTLQEEQDLVYIEHFVLHGMRAVDVSTDYVPIQCIVMPVT